MKKSGIIILLVCLIAAGIFILKILLEKSKDKVIEFTSEKLSEWSGMDITFEGFNLEEGRLLEVFGLHITTPYPKEDYAKINTHHTDWLDIRIKRLMLGNFSYDELIKDRKFHASVLEIDTAYIYVYRDKNLPDPPFEVKNLVSSLLHEINAKIHLDTLLLRKVAIVYEEKGRDFDESGQLRFENLYASGYNLSNIKDQLTDNQEFTLDVIASLMGKSKINAQLVFDLSSKEDQFLFRGDIEPFELAIVNPMIRGVLPAEIHSGQVHQLHFEIQANDAHSTGWLDMQYEDLKIQLYKDDNERLDKIKTLAANALIRNNNLEEKRHYRKGEISFKRNRDRFIFNYWWHSLQTGMVDVMLTDLAKTILLQSNNEDE